MQHDQRDPQYDNQQQESQQQGHQQDSSTKSESIHAQPAQQAVLNQKQAILDQKAPQTTVAKALSAMPDQSQIVIAAHHLEQKVKTASAELTILHQLNLQIRAGEQVAITGRSGSGKSTLLGLLAGLDRATQGEVFLCGQALHQLNEDERARVRLQYVGFVFQSFQLLNHLSALDNVMLPLTLSKTSSPKQARLRSQQLLEQVGLADRMLQTPRVLSGGEQQRVAIARALISEPQVIFADEPTGNLDGHTARAIEDLLFDLNRQRGTTLVLVTHDLELAARCNRQLHLQDGHFQSEPLPADGGV